MSIKLSSNNVCKYLLEVGICKKQDIELVKIAPRCTQAGRQSLIFLILDLPSIGQIFVKQAHHNNSNNLIKNEWKLQNFLHSCSNGLQDYFFTWEILHYDEANSILIYKFPPNYVNLESYYRNEKSFSSTIAELIGTTLANLHSGTRNSRNLFEFLGEDASGKLSYQFPHYGYLLDGKVTPETIIQELHMGGNSFLYFYQHFKSLRAAVTELISTRECYCLTHNNLYLDNILIPNQWEYFFKRKEAFDQPIIKLNNWEKCSWGDPCFDLGSVIAGYLLLWINSLIIHPKIDLLQTLKLATTSLEDIQPSIVSLTKAYMNNFPNLLNIFPDFLNQLIKFTGLALIYKIISNIQSFQNFNEQNLYALQLAAKLLCGSEQSFQSIFGMTNLAFIEYIHFCQKSKN